MSRSASQHLFSQIPPLEVPRSSFNRSHTVKTTFDAGKLIPFYIDEVYPGDTFNARSNVFARLTTPIVPAMDNAYMDTFFFFVPYRLLWKHWREFNGENLLPGIQSTEYVVPKVKADNAQVGTLWDYFGFPTGIAHGLSVSAFPFRAYAKVYNDWFRDENLQAAKNVNTLVDLTNADDLDAVLGADATVDLTAATPFYRGKRHDYFTSALPWPQKGPGVELPLGATASVSGSLPVSGRFNTLATYHNQSGQNRSISGFGSAIDPIHSSHTTISGQIPVNSDFNISYSSFIDGGDPQVFYNDGSERSFSRTSLALDNKIYADASHAIVDLSNATAVTINSLRSAFQLQKFYEKDARGGTRYTEIIRSHFGVVSPDARLQRAEYLGGTSTPIMFNPVMQTSATDGTSPQGNLAAYAMANTNTHGFNKSFVEHGIVIGLLNVRTDLSYQQGINRQWLRNTREDFYWPSFAHLGEQAVFNKEIYAQGTAVDDDVFGYQERYAELRYHPSIITGKMRSTYAQSLDVWHFAQKFDNLPALNSAFISDTASYQALQRIIAVQSEPQFYADIFVNLKCARPMPLYGVPGMVDHF